MNIAEYLPLPVQRLEFWRKKIYMSCVICEEKRQHNTYNNIIKLIYHPSCSGFHVTFNRKLEMKRCHWSNHGKLMISGARTWPRTPNRTPDTPRESEETAQHTSVTAVSVKPRDAPAAPAVFGQRTPAAVGADVHGAAACTATHTRCLYHTDDTAHLRHFWQRAHVYRGPGGASGPRGARGARGAARSAGGKKQRFSYELSFILLMFASTPTCTPWRIIAVALLSFKIPKCGYGKAIFPVKGDVLLGRRPFQHLLLPNHDHLPPCAPPPTPSVRPCLALVL